MNAMNHQLLTIDCTKEERLAQLLRSNEIIEAATNLLATISNAAPSQERWDLGAQIEAAKLIDDEREFQGAIIAKLEDSNMIDKTEN